MDRVDAATDRPVDNAPYLRHRHGTYTIEGWSRAAVQTCWRIPELKLGFDLGAQPWDFMGTGNWFLSHTHLDHVAALPVYVARRRMMKMEPPVIYLPAECVDDVQRLLLIMQRLDRGRQTCELVGMEAGAEVELGRDHVVTAWDTVHTIPSRGFVVWERRLKLKDEYVGLPGDRIRDLKFQGVAITKEIRSPLVAYTGDTAPAGLDACPAAFEAKILITELSFLRPNHRREKIHKFGHMHLDDLLEREDRFRNELIVAGHFSTRYHAHEIRRTLEAKLPESLRSRFKIWV